MALTVTTRPVNLSIAAGVWKIPCNQYPALKSANGNQNHPSAKSITPQSSQLDQRNNHNSPIFPAVMQLRERTSGEEDVCKQSQTKNVVAQIHTETGWKSACRPASTPGEAEGALGGRRRPETQQLDDLLLCSRRNRMSTHRISVSRPLMRMFLPRLSEADSMRVAPRSQPATIQPE